MKKLSVLLVLALIVVGATYGQTLQPVVGIASQSDAQRHYLLHLAALKNPAASGLTSVKDNAVAQSTAVEFNTWFENAVQGFNDVQVTRNEADQATALQSFLSQRDSQVAYYVGQMTSKLSPVGKSQFAHYVSSTIPKMQSGISKEQYDKMQLTDAERKSMAKLGGAQGNYQCNFSGFTCNVTYSLAASVNNSGAIPSTDTFARGNGGPGSNWTVNAGTFAIVSESISISSGGSGGTAFMHWSASTFNANQFSQVSLTSLPGTNASLFVSVRCSSSSNCYMGNISNVNGSYYFDLSKVVNGSLTHLGSFSSTPPPGYESTVALTVQGTTLSMFFNNDIILQIEDSSISSGQPGIGGTAGSGGANDWIGGNLGHTVKFNPILDGTENMPGNTSATHTPAVSFTKSGVKQSANGTGVCTSCYLLANHNFLEGFLPGEDAPINDGANITCTVAGVFFNTIADPGYVEDATTMVQNIDQNHSQGGKVFATCPDGGCEWEEPNILFQPNNMESIPFAWQYFTSAPDVGYAYKVQNWCTSTGQPDADFTSFKVVLPEIYLTGGTWGINPIITQGGTVLMSTFLFRISTTGAWNPTPWWADAWLPSFGNDPWNYPVSSAIPQLAMDGYGKGFCTISDTGGSGGSNRYKATITSANQCIEHNNQTGADGKQVECSH